MVIQCIDHGLTTSVLNLIVQGKGTDSLFSILNSLVNRSMYGEKKRKEKENEKKKKKKRKE